MVVAFVLEILLPAKQYVDQQAFTELTTLNISDAWRAAAILVGGIMAAVIAVLRLLETAGPRALLAGAVTVGAVALMLWLAEPMLVAMGRGSLVLFFIVIVGACVAIGVPIAFAFGISTVSYLALTSSMPLSVVVNRMDDGMSNLLLLSVPMFVFLGLLMEMTGIARVMVNFLASLLGHVRGGLSYVLLGAMYLVSGISGSKAADMAAVAPVLFPEMRRRGTHPGELACLLASSSAMSETIPPSLVLITIGSVTNVSIAALFTGGLLPAAVAALALVAVAWWRSRNEDTGGATRPPARFILRSFVIAVPGLTLPFVIRFAVMNGVATATEVSTVGVVYTALLGAFVYRQFDLRRIYPILVETLSLTGAVMLIIGTATAMAWALTQSGFSQWLVAGDGHRAGRQGRLPGDQHGGLHRARQRTGGHPRHRAVRTAAVSGGARAGRQRGPLCNRGDPGDGHRPVRAAVRRGLLQRLRHRPRVAGRCGVAHLAVSGSLGRCAGGGGRRALAIGRIL